MGQHMGLSPQLALGMGPQGSQGAGLVPPPGVPSCTGVDAELCCSPTSAVAMDSCCADSYSQKLRCSSAAQHWLAPLCTSASLDSPSSFRAVQHPAKLQLCHLAPALMIVQH